MAHIYYALEHKTSRKSKGLITWFTLKNAPKSLSAGGTEKALGALSYSCV
jgi:hypothetical protein